ncbi:MAG: NBR1-Ig-like domain-containing protein, partial [Anaerolineaceae bacterium]|nr:NBR1-Ig-like domain-containing protein [Anaerolineaceae bacterium]
MNNKFLFVLLILIIPLTLVCCTPQGSGADEISIEGKGETAAAYTMAAVLTQSAFETLEYKLTEIAIKSTHTPEPPIATKTPMNSPQSATPIPYYTPARAYCDWARYIKDVTIPDGTALAPGETFIKTWRFENIGSCTWTSSYGLVNIGGAAMGAARYSPLSATAKPTETVDISVELTAPDTPGDYLGLWNLSNESGELFGIGDDAKGIFWVKIRVKDPNQENIKLSLNMAENFCTAAWSSSTGALSCPSTVSLTNGSVNL